MSGKKSFKDSNPALEYISSLNESLSEEKKEPIKKEEKIQQIIETVNTQKDKQDEKRDKRFSLAVQPSLHDDLCVAATIYRTNLNDLCNSILIEYVDGKREKINKFRELSNQFFK